MKERILEAAFDLFARRGYEAVSTREIAETARVGAASMFKHFPSKEHLGRQLYELALAPIAQAFADLEARGPTPGEAVREAVAILYRMYDQRPRALALLVFPPHDFTPWEVDINNDKSVRNILRRLSRLDEDGEAVLWGAISGPLCDRFLRRRSGTMAPQAAAHAERIANLLTPSESKP